MLKTKEPILEIPKDNPFQNDILNRKLIITNLTKICDELSHSGTVIAIDAEWGTGKTTFVKLWKAFLESKEQKKYKEYKTIYFNAWESDFSDEPFMALISEVSQEYTNSIDRSNKVEVGKKIIIKTLGEIAKSIIKNILHFDTTIIEKALDEVVSHSYDNITEEYLNQTKILNDFKDNLKELVGNPDENPPLYFFIDELDRCNPHYAIKLLERIKHLFDVPNIIFVLSTNLNQLDNAVKGYFGSQNIDGKKYLKRFIDYEYILPSSNLEDYCKFAFWKYDLSDFFGYREHNDKRSLTNEGENFLTFITDIIGISNFNLRTINKLFSLCRLSLLGFEMNDKFKPYLFFLLCYIKYFDCNLYRQVKEGKIKVQELLNSIVKILPENLLSPNDEFKLNALYETLASLLIYYNFSERGWYTSRDIDFIPETKVGQHDVEINITSDQLNIEKLKKAMYSYNDNPEKFNILKGILNKIDFASYIKPDNMEF